MMMRRLFIPAFALMLFSACKTVVVPAAFSLHTAYLKKEIHTDRPLLDIAKQDTYKVTVAMQCLNGQKVKYATQEVIVRPDADGSVSAEGTKSNYITGFSDSRKAQPGTIWAYKTTFKTPVTNAKFTIKVGDSVVLSKVLTGKDVKVDYGFRLP